MIGLTALNLMMQRVVPKVRADDRQQRRVQSAHDAKILRRAGMVGTKDERLKARAERAAVLKSRGLKDSPQLRGNLTKAHAEGARGRAAESAAADKASQAARTVTGDSAHNRSDTHRRAFAAESQSGQQRRSESAETKRENATTKGRAASDNARADAEQRKQDGAQHREDAQERSKAGREGSVARGRNASDDARKRTDRRLREARDRVEQRKADSRAAKDLNVTQKQVREEREWQRDRAALTVKTAQDALQDTAGMAALPGGAVAVQAIVAARVAAADASYQLHTVRPILRDRAPAMATAILNGRFNALESALNALAA